MQTASPAISVFDYFERSRYQGKGNGIGSQMVGLHDLLNYAPARVNHVSMTGKVHAKNENGGDFGEHVRK